MISGAHCEQLDPRISYPSYKSFDEFVDVDALRALDGYVRSRIERRLAAEQDRRFYTGPFLLDSSAAELPGTRMIYLSRSTRAEDYYDLDNTDVWEPTEAAEEFSLLMDFIATLPFRRTGRMMIIYDDVARPVSAHRDHASPDLCHEFVWFRTNLDKPFYMLDPATGEQAYVRSHCAWFDTVNQFHGGDGRDGLTFSIRVDGVFDHAFRARIPVPAHNRASTPALWAALEQGAG
ncbi:MAG: hypothetical protein KY446_01155 [Proteobacteria bacterium]|nr:hypothetical protein [Pseudomonadota bacterium]